MCTPVNRLPNIFCRNTLDARNMVIVTEANRKQFAITDCGDRDMNCGSLRQMSSKMAKKGSRQPLKTCAIRITCTRGAEIGKEGSAGQVINYINNFRK